jgi:nitrite reductase (NADH) large subunit
MKQKLVIVGNGMAPGRALDLLFGTAPEVYEVTIFNAELRFNYDRIMLSPVLSGERHHAAGGWYNQHRGVRPVFQNVR